MGSVEPGPGSPRARRRSGVSGAISGPPIQSDPVRIPIEDALDLHAFAPRDIPSVVAEYLDAAREHGYREVRLIHGRGIGVQRRIVQSLLAKHPLVIAFADAPPERGGSGATIVALRPRA
jgi:DNA-nicking Smr family endonuclease